MVMAGGGGGGHASLQGLDHVLDLLLGEAAGDHALSAQRGHEHRRGNDLAIDHDGQCFADVGFGQGREPFRAGIIQFETDGRFA